MPDSVVEKPPIPETAQAKPSAEPVIGAPAVAAEKRHNFLYKLLHHEKKTADSAKEPATSVEAEPTPAVSIVPKTEESHAKPLTPTEIKQAELERRIAEAGKEGGLKVALEGRLERWHTEINRWLIKTEGVPMPMGIRDGFTAAAKSVFEPSGPDPIAENLKRQMVEVARTYLRAADGLVAGLRLKLGGPYQKGGQNGSNN